MFRRTKCNLATGGQREEETDLSIGERSDCEAAEGESSLTAGRFCLSSRQGD